MSEKRIDNRSKDSATDPRWKVIKNRVVLDIVGQNGGAAKQIIFKFSTTEQARVFAQYLRRSLAEREYSYSIQFMGENGFMSTPGTPCTTITKSAAQFEGLSKIRKNESAAKIEVLLFRTKEHGGNCKFTMYFASLVDMNICHELIIRGLGQTYCVIMAYRNNKRNHFWQDIETFRWCDSRVAKGCMGLDSDEINEVVEFINNLKSNRGVSNA